MLSYLFGIDHSTEIVVDSVAKLEELGSVNSYTFNKLVTSKNSMIIKINLGIIDHTFIIGISEGSIYLYQSYININPLVITKLDGESVIKLFTILNEIAVMSAESDHEGMCIKLSTMKYLSRLFGVPSSAIKIDLDRKFRINSTNVDIAHFYNKLIDICWIYYEKFVMLNKYISFDYLKKGTDEHLKIVTEDKYKGTDNLLADQFYGDTIYYEYKQLVEELCRITGYKKILELHELLEKRNKVTVVNNYGGNWAIALNLVENDSKLVNIVNHAAHTGVLHKIDPAQILVQDGLINELQKSSGQQGGDKSDEFIKSSKSIGYKKYKNRYMALKRRV
jgi:hypothetical protein